MRKSSIVLASLVLTLVLSGCSYLPIDFGDRQSSIPSEKTTVKSVEVSRIHGIEMRAAGKVNLHQGDVESVTITGPRNVVPRVIVENRNGTLVLDMEKTINVFSLFGTRDLTFDVQFKDLDSLLVSGMGYVDAPKLAVKTLDISMSGAGQIKLNRLQANDVDVSISGLGDVTINGQAEQFKVGIPGKGDVLAGDLACKTAKVTISGLGNATVWATDKLTGNISGNGCLSYFGEPALNSSATGHGTFKSLGGKQSS